MNVRELREALHTALTLDEAQTIRREHLPATVRRTTATSPTADKPHDRKQELLLLLERHRGNITHVAKTLGKQRQQIQRWCRSYGIDPTQFRDR